MGGGARRRESERIKSGRKGLERSPRKPLVVKTTTFITLTAVIVSWV